MICVPFFKADLLILQSGSQFIVSLFCFIWEQRKSVRLLAARGRVLYIHEGLRQQAQPFCVSESGMDYLLVLNTLLPMRMMQVPAVRFTGRVVI